MGRFAGAGLTAARMLASFSVAALAASMLVTLYRVVVIGQYWDTAPIFLTLFVALICPVGVVAGACVLLRGIWSKSK